MALFALDTVNGPRATALPEALMVFWAGLVNPSFLTHLSEDFPCKNEQTFGAYLFIRAVYVRLLSVL